jgi:hypothetical protein
MKFTSKSVTVLLFVLVSIPVFCQIDFKHFPIDSFKLPSIHWVGLELGGAINGSYDYGHELQGDRKSTASFFSPDVSLTYTGYINRPDKQLFYSISTNPDFSISRSNDEINDRSETDRYFSPDGHLFWSQLKYHSKSFFQFGVDTDIDYSKRYTRTEMNSVTITTKHSNINSSIATPIGFGRGRLEPVSDVVMALFLLKDAVGIGLDSQLIQSEDVVAFAELMATVRNKRVFDTRRKRVFELRSLYDFMLAKGWVLQNDPGFFTVLTDNWLYNFNYPRYSGNRWTYLLTPKLSSDSNLGHTIGQPNSDTQSQSFGSEVSVEYAHYKSQNLYRNFRRIHSIEIGVDDNHNKSNDLKTNYSILHGKFSNSIGYGWFPNTRTQILSSLSLTYEYSRFLKEPEQIVPVEKEQHTVNAALSGNCTYFLSYKTQLNISASIGYNHRPDGGFRIIGGNFILFDDGSDGINADLTASISVFLF